MASPSVFEESFLHQVERVREEIRDNFLRSHQMLLEREAALMAELDQLVGSYRGEGVREQIQELNRIKESLESTAHLNGNQETVVKSVAVMNDRIRELDVSLETTETRMRRVELEWDGELEGRLREIGRIRLIGQLDYKKKGEPVITMYKHSRDRSTEPGVFCSPLSLAIEPYSENIYICDSGNYRIQVFSNSLEFIFQFDESMNKPFGICISEYKIYVTQSGSHCLNVYSIDGKLLQSVGKKGDGKLEFDQLRGVEVSIMKNLIYICDKRNNRIQCLNLDLIFNSFILHIFGPRDIKLTQNEIIVLKGGYHCISLFNYSHQFVREMIRCGEGTPLLKPLFLFLDAGNNVLITDFASHCINIFSIRGELIHRFGRELSHGRDFSFPTGIVLNSQNMIIVLSFSFCNCLHFF